MESGIEAYHHYLIDRPAVISFSGGRTSGYMLWHIIQAFGGKLPDDVKVIFNNTGKEREETLQFVERCSQRWDVPITWLEYRNKLKNRKLKKTRNGKIESPYEAWAEVVDITTASRNGEPFKAAIRARNMLPNGLARLCTVECKTLTTVRYLQSLGWESWTIAIGFRFDEPARFAKLQTTNRHGDEDPVAPMYHARVTKSDVLRWWDRQPFNLQLEDHEGNCDLCFLKSPAKIKRIMRDRPDLAEWWIDQEDASRSEVKHQPDPTKRLFRIDRPRYSKLLELAQLPTLFDSVEQEDELSISCSCTD